MYDDNPLYNWKCPDCGDGHASYAKDTWICPDANCHGEWDITDFVLIMDDEDKDSPDYGWYIYIDSEATTSESDDEDEDEE